MIIAQAKDLRLPEKNKDIEMKIKEFSVEEKGDYPDFGCDVEAYTNPGMLELETVGPLKNLEPGSAAEHREIWSVEEIPLLSPCQKDMEEKLIKKGVI